MEALLEALGDVFGGAGETPSVFGVVGGEEGGGYEGHPAVVTGVAVFDSRHLLIGCIALCCIGLYFLYCIYRIFDVVVVVVKIDMFG